MPEEPKQWITDAIAQSVREYGVVRPPYAVEIDTHPCEMRWRMGAGESAMMVWWQWWEDQQYDEGQALLFFQKWPPPPCWLGWTADTIWNLQDEKWWPDEEGTHYAPYFAKLQAAGLGTWAEYERDSNDPKWLDGDG